MSALLLDAIVANLTLCHSHSDSTFSGDPGRSLWSEPTDSTPPEAFNWSMSAAVRKFLSYSLLYFDLAALVAIVVFYPGKPGSPGDASFERNVRFA